MAQGKGLNDTKAEEIRTQEMARHVHVIPLKAGSFGTTRVREETAKERTSARKPHRPEERPKKRIENELENVGSSDAAQV